MTLTQVAANDTTSFGAPLAGTVTEDGWILNTIDPGTFPMTPHDMAEIWVVRDAATWVETSIAARIWAESDVELTGTETGYDLWLIACDVVRDAAPHATTGTRVNVWSHLLEERDSIACQDTAAA